MNTVSTQGLLKRLTASQGNCKLAAVSVCRLGLLNPGQTVTVTAIVRIDGETTFKSSAKATPVDNEPGNNEQTVVTALQ